MVFCFLKFCSSETARRFGWTYCFHLQDKRVSQARKHQKPAWNTDIWFLAGNNLWPWRWRYVPPKRQYLTELYGVTTQKPALQSLYSRYVSDIVSISIFMWTGYEGHFGRWFGLRTTPSRGLTEWVYLFIFCLSEDGSRIDFRNIVVLTNSRYEQSNIFEQRSVV
jgi:hypothetical protein